MTDKPGWGFAPGDLVDGFRIERALGGGTAYDVYAATVFSPNDSAYRSLLGKELVVKFVRPDRVARASSLRRLRREAELLQRLSHPNVVSFIAVDESGPRPHLTLEYVEGPTLKELVRSGSPAPAHVIAIGAAVASALTALHEAGVVHLDVKPSSVILGAVPTLIDFSVARTADDAARLAKAVGTDLWMAPEQTEPQTRGPVGPAADVWGLGATLWFCVLGRAPFRRPKGYDRSDVLQRFPQLAASPRPLPPHLPDRLADTLTACLSRAPKERPAAAAVADTLTTLRLPASA